MSNNLTVEVARGRHSHPVPADLSSFLEGILADHGIAGHYKAQIGAAVKGTAHTPRFKAQRVTNRGTVECYAKTGSNDSALQLWLAPTDGTGMPATELMARLANNNGKQPAARGRFVDEPGNVQAFLELLKSERFEPVTKLRSRGASIEPLSAGGWGNVMSALERRGLIALKRRGRNLTHARLAPGGIELLRAAAPKPVGGKIVAQMADEAPSADNPVAALVQRLAQEEHEIGVRWAAAQERAEELEQQLEPMQRELAQKREEAAALSKQVNEAARQLAAARTTMELLEGKS